jgi:hypothetical protein
MALNTIPNKGLTSRGYPSDRLVTPIIINGDMSVAQRGTSATGIGNGDSGYHTVDRWQFTEVGTTSGEFTITQDTDVPTGQGFAKSTKFDVTTADTSLGSTHQIYWRQGFEGQNLQMLKKGTSNAEQITVSFWVKSNKTGTYIVYILDGDNSRFVSKSYTISSSSTWEKKTITFPADTTGTLDNDNEKSLTVHFVLGAGTDFSSGTLQETWGAVSGNNANRLVGQVNLLDSTSNEWYITGVQLEVGEFDSTTLPSFPFESFENNLRKCYRYTQKHPQKDTSGNYGIIAQGMADGSTLALCNINPLPVEMRTTASLSSSGSFRAHKPGGASSVSSIAINSDHVSSSTFAIRVTTSGITAGHSIFLEQNNDADAHVILDSEL